MSETIQLTETSRLRVIPDEDAQCPRGDWEQLTGFVKIERLGDSRLSDVPAVHESPIDIRKAHDAFDAAGWVWKGGQVVPRPWRIDIAAGVARWARIFHDTHLEFDHEHGGYWFVDRAGFDENWSPIAIVADGSKLYQYDGEPRTRAYIEAKVIEQEQETYRQWAEGEVYGVILERAAHERIITTHHDGRVTEDEAITWEQPDTDSAIWGCYLDDKYTAQVVAGEHFDLTEEETTALGLTPSAPA